MMTKYQLVFVKLETAMKKIIASIEARKRLRLKRGFQAFKNNNFEFKVADKLNKRRKLVCARFELTLEMMLAAFNRYHERSHLSEAFRTMKEHSLTIKASEASRQKHLKKMTDMQQDLVKSIKKIENLNSKQEEIDQESSLTKKKITEQQRYQKDLEEREVKLNGELIQLLEK